MTNQPNYIPHPYLEPFGMPRYWRDEVSGKLAIAISSYISYGASLTDASPTPEELEIVRQYFQHWINAPCWLDKDGELTRLREFIKTADTIQKLNEFLEGCIRIAIDPL